MLGVVVVAFDGPRALGGVLWLPFRRELVIEGRFSQRQKIWGELLVGMKNREDWTQGDSDLVGHFLDVVSIISRSVWYGHKLKVSIREEDNSDLPPQEPLVFASVYFRQLFSQKDRLLKSVHDLYLKFSDDQRRMEAVRRAFKQAKGKWNDVPTPNGLWLTTGKGTGTQPTLSELFDAFLYGTHVLHSIGPTKVKHEESLRELLNACPPHVLLGSLNFGLRDVFDSVKAVYLLCEPEFRDWFHSENLPPPNIRWQGQLFNRRGPLGAREQSESRSS